MSDRPGADRVARALLIAGTTLATVAVGAWVLDVIPSLPAWMLRIAVYKLALGSGLGLMIAGAALRRALRAPALPNGRAGVPLVGEGAIEVGGASRDRSRDPVARTRDD